MKYQDFVGTTARPPVRGSCGNKNRFTMAMGDMKSHCQSPKVLMENT